MQAPDFCAPIVGWRAWGLVLGADGARLRSPLYEEDWPPGVAFRARCRAGTAHAAAETACTCGVHASSTAAAAAEYLVGRDEPRVVHRVLGRVALWGRVVEAERGWRGAFAYPVELLVPTRHANGRPVDAAVLGRALAPYGVAVRALRGRRPVLLESSR